VINFFGCFPLNHHSIIVVDQNAYHLHIWHLTKMFY
jgi:hypothetical protein